MKFYLELFLIFFKIGMFTIGGGYAMFPVVKKGDCRQQRLVERCSVFTYE